MSLLTVPAQRLVVYFTGCILVCSFAARTINASPYFSSPGTCCNSYGSKASFSATDITRQRTRKDIVSSISSVWDSDLIGQPSKNSVNNVTERNLPSHSADSFENTISSADGKVGSVHRNSPVSTDDYNKMSQAEIKRAIYIARFQLQQMDKLYTPGISRSFFTARSRLMTRLKRLIEINDRYGKKL